MKLRLQLANVLPASPKSGPAGSLCKVTFGTAMQQIMSTSFSKQSLVGTPSALLQKQLQMAKPHEMAKPDQTISDSDGDRDAKARSPLASTPMQQTMSQSAKAFLSEELPPESARQVSIGHAATPRRIPVNNELLQEISPENGHAKQVLADAALPGATSSKGEAPREKHRAVTMWDGPTLPADSEAVALPVVSQPVDVVVPVLTLSLEGPASQADGSQPGSLKPNSKAVSARVQGQDASSQVSAPAMALSYSDQRGIPLTTAAPLTGEQPSGVTASTGGKFSAPVISADTNSANSATTAIASQPIGKPSVTLAMPVSQTLHPQGTSSPDGAEIHAKQADVHTPKDAGGKTNVELKSEARLNVSGLNPTPPAVQHQALLDISPVVSHGVEKAVTHRPELSAAQVLQRMDMASYTGAVPLRADARRLDVGVSSDALGWVEVRVTTSASGRVDAALHVQNDASAQVLSSQSREISDYAREHAVPLGQVSVGVGTGDSAQGQSHPEHTHDRISNRVKEATLQPATDTEQTHHAVDAVSLISIRA